MAGTADARRQEVLRAIVADFISRQEPVGSKALLERHHLPVSSATIRNDMAVLESEGFIMQQHASSGRIPTEKGYRAFVDSLQSIKPMSLPEKRAVMSFLEEGVDLEDVLKRSVQLLAQFTRQAAVIQVPTLTNARVKHCEVVALGPRRLLLVLITDTGRVDQRNVELLELIDDSQVHLLRELLNSALQGKTMHDASDSLAERSGTVHPDMAEHVRRSATTLIETLVEQPSDRLIMAGASNLMRGQSTATLPGIIEALEEQVVVLKLMADLPALGDVAVHIGGENPDEELHSTSVVATAYGGEGTTLGGLGVVGPTYMDYPGTISRVSAVAGYVGRILSGE